MDSGYALDSISRAVVDWFTMGALPELDRRPLRFGVFELNPTSGELCKHGVRVRLQEQPLKLLLCLIETPGEICTREELIRRIWPEGTFVDYERGLNVAITRLRQVLGDSADTPRYVETVGRKGYRFIAPVERIPALEIVPPAGESSAPVSKSIASRSQWWPYAVAVLIAVLAILAAVGWLRAPRPQSQPFARLSIDLGPEVTATGYGAGSLLALSPDGKRLAISVSGPDGKVRLATRRIDQSQLTFLAGTEGAGKQGSASPFFSPDGQWIGFFAQGKLKKIAAEGGQPVTLCDADTHAAGRASIYYPTGSWGDDGNIVAALNVVVGLSRIPAVGGPPVLLKMKQEHAEVYRWPQVLPGNQAVLFTASRGDYENGNIDVFSLKTGERKTVLQGGILGRYLPSGHLVFLRQNVLLAVPFDLQTLKLKGEPQPVLEDMGGKLEGWNFDFSLNGSFVYVSQPRDSRNSIFWLDRDGKVSPLQAAPGFYASPRFSPDGTRMAFSMSGRSSQGIWVQDIWVQNLELGTASRLTSLPGVNDSPVWTADGRSVIFRSVSQPNAGIYAVRADGGGEARRLADLSTGVFPSSLSPDGRRLAIWDFASGGEIWTAPIESGPDGFRFGRAELFLKTAFDPPIVARTTATFSPDGRWLAHSSLESGHIEVYVRAFPGPGGKWLISTTGGTHPVWSRNGRELYYLDFLSKRLMVVSYKVMGDSFVPGKPTLWSEKRVLDLGELYSYDVAPDGKRVAVVLFTDGTAEQKPANSLTFLLNFFDELQRRVPKDNN
jgi:Tol biopolymer transport system component/DNA-binding winged helix-turn-helix (wHTH) protein